jgi:hypothetical protein
MGVSSPAAVSAVRAALADGPLTRHELAAAVRARGVPISSDPQAPIHLVMCSALEGHVLQAGAKAGEPVYGLAVDRLGPAPRRLDREAALLELARRHVRAFPPSGPEDFAAWSGLGLADSRRAFARLAGSFVEVQVRGRRALVPAGLAPAEPHVRLLPAFDSALLGHRDRALTVRPEHGRSVLPGGGVLRPTLMVDGLVEGTWRLRAGVADVSPFAEMAPDVAAAVTAEVADVARHRAS